MTIRPLVDLLHVTREQESAPTVGEQIHIRFFDHLLSGIEDISGHWGQYYWKDKLEYLNSKYLQKFLLREYEQPKSSIVLLYEKLERKHAIELAEAGRLIYGPSRNTLLNNDKPASTVNDSDSLNLDVVDDIQKILERNLYKTRRTVPAYNRHNLTGETEPVEQAKEILILRQKSWQIHMNPSDSENSNKEKDDTYSLDGASNAKPKLCRSLTVRHSRKPLGVKSNRSKSVGFIIPGTTQWVNEDETAKEATSNEK